MMRLWLASVALVCTSAGAQTFAVEFWPAVPDRTRQVQHFFSCPAGARLVFKQPGPAPSRAVVGGWVFVGRGAPSFLGLYRIERVDGTPAADGKLRDVTVHAVCTTGLS